MRRKRTGSMVGHNFKIEEYFPQQLWTSNSDTKKLLSGDPHARRLKSFIQKGQEKSADPKDALRRNSTPRSSKIKTKISLNDSTTVNTPLAKAADRETIYRHSPKEVEHALIDYYLPEEYILSICTLAEPPPPKKKQ